MGAGKPSWPVGERRHPAARQCGGYRAGKGHAPGMQVQIPCEGVRLQQARPAPGHAPCGHGHHCRFLSNSAGGSPAPRRRVCGPGCSHTRHRHMFVPQQPIDWLVRRSVRYARGKLAGRIANLGAARGPNRARPTLGIARQADRGTEIHQTLGVTGHAGSSCRRQQVRACTPGCASMRSACGRHQSAAGAPDAAHVGVEEWRRAGRSRCGNRRRGERPMPGKGSVAAVARELPPCSCTTAAGNGAGCGHGCSNQPAPQGQHVIQACRWPAHERRETAPGNVRSSPAP